MALLVPLYPGVFFEGHALLPGGIVFETPPWKEYRPEGFERTKNLLPLDVLCAFQMDYRVCKEAIQNREWPLWNPREFGGLPLLASYQPAVFYPPRLLQAFLGLYLGTTIHTLLKLWLCGATAYLCARGMGLRPSSSRFLSVGWMLCSFNAIWCYWPVPDGAAWLPILFLGVEWILLGLYRRGFWLVTLGATLILLAGHPESVFAMGCCAGLYFVLRLACERRWRGDLWRPVAVAGGAWVVALLVCAVQLAPFIEYMVNSYHFIARPDEDPSGMAVPASAWVLFWVPRFYGVTADGNFWGNELHSNFTNFVFPGIAVWFGVPFLIRRFWGSGRIERIRIICLVACCVFCFLCAFNYGGVRPLLRLPVVRSMWFRWFVGAAVFPLLLGGALGLDGWFSKPRKVRELLWAVVPAVGIAAAVFALYRFHEDYLAMKGYDDYVWRQVLIAAFVAVLCLLCLAAYCIRQRPRLMMSLLTLILACDLILAVRGMHPTSPPDWLFPDTELTDFLKDEPAPYRVTILTSSIPTGFLPICGIEQWFAYSGILPHRVSRFNRALGDHVWRGIRPALGIRYFLHNPEQTPYFLEYAPGRFESVGLMNGIEVYRDLDEMSRAFLVGTARVMPGIDEMFEAMRNDDFDPSRVALLEKPLPEPFTDSGAADLGQARVIEHTYTRVTVEANAADDCILVLADAYYPGWEARIDGNRAEIFPVYSIFRGIQMPPGPHTIEFRYNPPTFRFGLLISTCTLVVSLAAALIILHRRRRRRVGE